MTDDEKKAAIYAKYWLMAVDMCSAKGIRAEAESIEKVTTDTPKTSPSTYSRDSSSGKADENAAAKAKSPPAVISLPFIPASSFIKSASPAPNIQATPVKSLNVTRLTSDAPSVTRVEYRPPLSAIAKPAIILPNLVITGTLASSIAVNTIGKKTIIGQDFEAGKDIAVADKEREGGFYVLGQPRTGKSNLLVSMALQDIKNGHGLLFIDPHTDAINDLLARIPERRLNDVIFLDPAQKSRSFGINLLHCTDPTDPMAIEDTWGRIRDVFVKLWEQETGQLGFWVDKILRNSVYLLVETGDYSMVEAPLLLEEDTTFRNSLLEKVAVKPFVKDFWYKEIDRLTRRDKTQQVDPALNRLGRFRDNEYLRYIVGQTKSTIDFQRIMAEKKIVLLLLPANLTGDVKDAIGTMVLSELLYAVNERAKLDRQDRPYFGVYCDEFQEFATPDFAKLFTQTGKFGVMPVVAHQTREQFKSRDDPNRGATAASPNKAFFTLSPIDAKEMPLVFAKEPPPEIRFEEQLVISQNPVRDLLHGHMNPDIRRFVNKYLRYLDDKREDIRADMEGLKFARMIELDTAAFFGAEAQEEGVIGGSHIASQIGAINERQSAILKARMHAVNLDVLQKHTNRIRVTMRGLNRFLTQVMEGERCAGQEAFADFLISLAAGYSALPEAYAGVLGLYIKLSYGDNNNTRVIPIELGTKVAFLSGETARLTSEAARLQAEKRRSFERKYKDEEWGRFYSKRKTASGRREGMKRIIAKAMANKLDGGCQWHFLRYWPKEDNGWGLAQVVAKRAGYGGIGSIYYEDIWMSYSVEHFAPEMDYTNDCAVDFSPGKSGKEALDSLRRSDKARSYINSAGRRKDVSERRKLIQARWGYLSRERPAAARVWEALDAVVRWYLLMRSCDWVMYGKEFADRSFPDPSNSDYSGVVSALVWLFEEHEAQLIKTLEDAEEAKEREHINKYCADSVEKIVVSPPAQLTPRVLDAAQIRTVRDACVEEIKRSPQVVYEVAETIDEFARFCVLLAKPENHIKVRSTQYVEKPVRARTEIDMVNEQARLLSSVAPYTAHVRLEKKEGETGAWTGKVRMKKLEGVADGALQKARRAIEEKAQEYTRPREEIRREIEERRSRIRPQAPSVHIEAVKEEAPPRKSVSEPEEEPPPPRRAAAGKKAQEKKGPEDEALRTQGDIKSAFLEGPDKPQVRGSVPQIVPQSATRESPPQTTGMRLVYRSNFDLPDDKWELGDPPYGECFRQDGHYHIKTGYSGFGLSDLRIPVADFRIHFDAEFLTSDKQPYKFGLYFRGVYRSFYNFSISNSGCYELSLRFDSEWKTIIDERFSELIKRGNSTNSVMVEMVGQQIVLGINGHILDTVMDNRMANGSFSLYVSTRGMDSGLEVRFHNFLLYAIE